MLVLKNIGSNKSIGVMKSIFTLGYDILQKELDTIFCDCDESFNLCVLYYNEFYHSEYNDQNISEYEAVVKFKNNNEVSIEEYLKRVNLMFQICQYYEYTLSFDVSNMTICIYDESKKYYNTSQYQYYYNTMAEFALGWIITCVEYNDKLHVWTDEDLNRLRNMAGIKKEINSTEMEEVNMKTRYYVCGIGYDKNNRIVDYERDFGDFDTYEEAYELFVKLQCRNPESFFSHYLSGYQILIQIEECEEIDDKINCIDVKNELWIVNPKF